MQIPTIPLIACVVGVLVYALASNTKLSEVGRITFAMAMLVLLLALSRPALHLL